MYLLFLFAIFSLGQLGRISFWNQEINFYLYEPLLVVGLIYFFIKFRTTPLKETFKKYKIVLIFIASLFFSFLISFFGYTINQNLVSFLYLIRLLAYLLFFLYLWFFLKKKKLSLVKETSLFLIITAVTSFIQFFFYPDLQNLVYLGWDPHFHRMFGVFFDTSSAGAIYGLSFLFIVIKLMKDKKAKKADIAMCLLFLSALILTFARSSYISLFIALFYYLSTKNTFRFAIFFAMVFFVLFIISPKQFGKGVGLTRTFSISSRISDYQQGIGIWLKHPLFGVGYNRIRYVKEKLNLIMQKEVPSHAVASFSSSYLMVLISGGIVGFVLFIGSVLTIMRKNREIGLLVLFTAVLSFFDNIFLHPFIMFLLGSFLVHLNLLFDKSRK